MHVHRPVLRFTRMLEHPYNRLPDRVQGRGAEKTIPAVKEVRALLSHVGDEADLEAPIEKRAVKHERVAQCPGIRFLLKRILDGDFVFIHGQAAGLGVQSVGAEFGGDEALDARVRRGEDEIELDPNSQGGESRDQGVMAFERIGHGVDSGVIHGNDSHGRGKRVRATLTGKDGNLEAGREQFS